MSDFGKSEEKLPSEEKFYNSLTGTNISDKEYELALRNKLFGINLK